MFLCPRKPLPRSILYVISGASALLLIAGCRGPQDPDLTRKAAQSSTRKVDKQNAPLRTSPAPATQNKVLSVELKTYSAARIAEILDAVPSTAEARALPPESKRLRMTLDTANGAIECTLDHRESPQATANFVALASGLEPWRDPDTGETLKTRFYDGMTFNRTIKNFIIQTGNPGARASGGPGWAIAREGDPRNRYDAPGALGMVDSADDTHGSQFFITLRKQTSLKERYSAFGVCESMDIVKQIANAPKEAPKKEGKTPTKPIDPVRISRVTLRWAPVDEIPKGLGPTNTSQKPMVVRPPPAK